MISPSVPPSSGAVSDAMSLLTVLSDPKAAQALLAKYKEAADTHDQQLASVMARLKESEAKEAELKEREAKVAAREEAQAKNEDNVNQALAVTNRTIAKLAADKEALAKREQAHQQAVKEFNELKAAHDTEHKARMSAVVEQEAQNVTDHQDRMASLDAREAELVKRADAVTQAEKALENRHAKLRAALSE